MGKRLLATLFAASLLVAGMPVAASADPGDDLCKIEILGWRPC